MAMTFLVAALDFYSVLEVGCWWWMACLAIVALAYLFRFHRIYGKNSFGRLPIWSWLVFLPWHSFTWLIWYLDLQWNPQPGWQWVDGRLAVGRRPLPGEIKDHFDHFVDLTAEFSEVRHYRELPGYVCFPILDGTAPSPELLLEAVRGVRSGKTFVHCAKGHGRTGMFAIAILLNSGRAKSLEEGLSLLQTVRPGVRLNRVQKQCLERFLRIAQSCRPIVQV